MDLQSDVRSFPENSLSSEDGWYQSVFDLCSFSLSRSDTVLTLILEMRFLCEGSCKLWCPRVNISTDTDMKTSSHDVNHSGAHLSTIFPPSVASSVSIDSDTTTIRTETEQHSNHFDSKICIGRGLLYREERYLSLSLSLS